MSKCSITATILLHFANSTVDQIPENPLKSTSAGVAELVDARDLKSLVGKRRAGSSPAFGTNILHIYQVVTATPKLAPKVS